MNDKVKLFNVVFYPEGKNFQEERKVQATDGLKAIEKIREHEGQLSVVINISEVNPDEESQEPLFFVENNLPSVSFENETQSLRFTGADNKDILRLESNGDIYIHGRFVTKDEEVIQGLHDFLSGIDKC